MSEAILLIIVGVATVTIVLTAASNKAQGEYDYHRGYRDHEEVMRLYEMSPDDEALLKELKQAVKLYIKQTGLYRSGDVKNLESATDFKEFKDRAWEVTVKRREQK